MCLKEGEISYFRSRREYKVHKNIHAKSRKEGGNFIEKCFKIISAIITVTAAHKETSETQKSINLD